jgi:hypothetical protein
MVAGMDSNAALLNGGRVLWKGDSGRMARISIASLFVALIGLGTLLISRRLVGAVDGSLPAVMLLQAWLLVGAIALSGRLVSFRDPLSRPPRPIFHERPKAERRDEVVDAIVIWGGSLGIALWAIGCSFGGRWVDWVLWVGLMAADQGELWWLLRRGGATAISSGKVRRGAGTATTGRGFLQEVVRMREGDGVEMVRARLRAEFAAGQRQAVLHVGFCPPLDGAPIVEAAVASSEPAVAPGADASGWVGEAEVRVVQAFCHGARLEVRLAEPAKGECAVMVAVSAKPSATADLRQAAAVGTLPCGGPAGRG